MKKIKQIVTAAKQQQVDDRKVRLENAISKVAELEPNYKALDKQMTENKSIIKTLCLDLKLDTYEFSGKKVSITHVDKSFLDIGPTIEYLKKNGLERFIKTKEYFDEAELAMAIVNNEIKAEELAPFTVQKEEVRLNIK
jgi:phage host-nuclease inhibitor protein Gam